MLESQQKMARSENGPQSIKKRKITKERKDAAKKGKIFFIKDITIGKHAC